MEQKKKYFTPWMEVMFVSTADIMKTNTPSDTPNTPGAPERQPKAF